jgi:hypothetical protein
MDERRDEETVAELFRACGLTADRYPASGYSKTPDFLVSGPRGEAFICEVKSVRSTPDKEVSNDSLYGAITSDVATARKQFAGVNSAHLVPNVLAWVTHNPRYNITTFKDLVRGKVMIQGRECADLGKQRYGRFARDFAHIDMFLWIHSWGAPDRLYNVENAEHYILLKRLLGRLAHFEKSANTESAWIKRL